MKKIIALLLAVLMAGSLFILAGCGSTTATSSMRWENGESYTYNVSLAGVNLVGGLPSDFCVMELSEDVTVDQVKPISANGTYTMTISQYEEEIYQFTTSLNLAETYFVTDFTEEALAEFVAAGVAVVDLDAATVVLTTTISTLCRFYNSNNYYSSKFPPIYSERTVTGGYVGKERQAPNNYKVTCSYRYENKNYCDIEFIDYLDGHNSFTETVRFSGQLCDNEMLMLLVRSYDISTLIAASSTTINVLEPIIQKGVASITLQAATITENSEDTLAVKRYLSSTFNVETINYVAASATGALTAYSSLVYFFDNAYEKTINGHTMKINPMLKYEQGYLVYTLNDAGLTALGYTPAP